MDWIQVLTIIGTLGAFGFYLGNRLDNDISSLSNRLNSDISSLSNRLDANNQRTDRLYQMFIDLLKEKK